MSVADAGPDATTPGSASGESTPNGRGYSPELRTAALLEALPYIQRFRGAVIVVKLGGNAIVDDDVLRTFAQDIVMLRSVGLRPVVVHGGGPQIGDLLERLGKTSEFVDGLRVTDDETLDVARMVLVGQVGRRIVGHINTHGAYAVGMSGEDGGLIRASVRDPALGHVGDVQQVNPGIIERLLAEDMIPVVSSIGVDPSGQALNINADTVAGALGGALRAEKVVFLTNVSGLLTDVEDPGSLVARADLAQIDGRVPHVLLLELFTDAGIGTMITPGNQPTTDFAADQTGDRR